MPYIPDNETLRQMLMISDCIPQSRLIRIPRVQRISMAIVNDPTRTVPTEMWAEWGLEIPRSDGSSEFITATDIERARGSLSPQRFQDEYLAQFLPTPTPEPAPSEAPPRSATQVMLDALYDDMRQLLGRELPERLRTSDYSRGFPLDGIRIMRPDTAYIVRSGEPVPEPKIHACASCQYFVKGRYRADAPDICMAVSPFFGQEDPTNDCKKGGYTD